MQKFIRAVAKFFFYMTYPIILIALIVSLVFNYIQQQEIAKVNDTFIQARDELNADNQDKQVTIEDLRQEFNNLNARIETLQQENAKLQADLSNFKEKGLATITGKIFAVVTSSKQGFSQYQMVCAELISNNKTQYCVTVSALDQTFALNLPAGEYKVYAQLFPQPEATSDLYGVKAYYTDYVKCVQEKDSNQCNAPKLSAPVVVSAKSGAVVSKVDVIDWR